MSTYDLEGSRFHTADARPAAKSPRLRPPGRVVPRGKPTDAVLVSRIRAGDEGAFETIFRRYEPPLLSYCRHMLGDRSEAEDALQQAFIRAHRAITSSSPPRELRPWLYTIARNCCVSALASRRSSATLDDHEPSIAGLSDTVSDRADLRELVSDLQGLPEDQRSALLLAELGDLSHEQIAAVVDCPTRKVKALIHQARTTLIAQRQARAASCEEIRTQLSVARGGELRRGLLRRHVGLCPGCREYAAAVSTQRSSLALVLPVLPTADLAARVLGHAAVGTTAGAGGLGVAGGHAAAVIAGGGGSASAIGSAGISGAGAAASAGASAITAGVGAVSGTAAIVAGAAGGSGAAGLGAALGTGLAAKLAIGGAVAVLASAGAAATFRGAPTSARQTATVAASHPARLTGAGSRGSVHASAASPTVVRRVTRRHLRNGGIASSARKTQSAKTRSAATRREALRSAAARRKATASARARRRAVASRPLRTRTGGSRIARTKAAGSTRTQKVVLVDSARLKSGGLIVGSVKPAHSRAAGVKKPGEAPNQTGASSAKTGQSGRLSRARGPAAQTNRSHGAAHAGGPGWNRRARPGANVG